MVFCRKWLLILAVLLAGSGSLLAASAREEHAYAAAVAAFHDGIYSQAESSLQQFVEKYPKSIHVPEAILLQAQAEYQQGKYATTIATLSAPKGNWSPLRDQYDYWKGEAQFARGDYQHAVETFTNLAARFPTSPLSLSSEVEAASAFKELGDWVKLERLLEQTNGVFAARAAMDGGNELVSRGRLLLAQAQVARKNYARANATLKLLHLPTLTPELDWQRVSLQCQVLLGLDDLDAALDATTNLLNLARQQPDAAARFADSVALRGTVLERLGNWKEAASVWSQNLTNTAPETRQREAILKLAETAVKQNQFTNAATALAAFLLQYSNSPAASLATLTLGELNLQQYILHRTETNHLSAALLDFNLLLSTNVVPAHLIGRAHLDRGWCYWFGANYPASLADFQAAARRLPFSAELAVARFKMGDALFAMTNYSRALTNYQSVVKDFGDVRAAKLLGDHALYQMIRCCLKLKDAAGAEKAMHRLLQEYPKSELADNGMLLLGEGLANLVSPTNAINGNLTNAVEVLRGFAKQFPHSTLNPQVKMELARAFEREQDWPAAIAGYLNWLGEYPTNHLRPQVEYALAWVEYQSGNERNALRRFTHFVSRHPTNSLAPQAQWWVADYYFRQGGTNYSEAEKNYEYIFQNTNAVWQNSPLFYPAQLMAGRAAAGRLGFSDAARYFTEMMADTNCPPEMATKAQFAYGGVLMRWESSDTNRPLANYELATNVFAGLCAANATNEYGPKACNELGDCDFQIGALDAATNAYVQAMNSPYASVGLRCRARVGLGRVLEQMAANAPAQERKALLERALANYFQVFQTNLGRGLEDNEAPEAFWVKKAGLQMLPLMTTLKEGKVDSFFNRMERLMPQLKDSLEKKRAAMEAQQ